MPYQFCAPANDGGWKSIGLSPEISGGNSGNSTNVSANEYSGVVLSSAAQIRRLRDSAKRLMRTEDTMLSPEFFLASLGKGWGPKVVAVRDAHEVIGILYARQRTIKGFPTGVVYADGSLGSVLLTDPLYHKSVFRVAVQALLASSGIGGMRLRVLRSSRDFDAVLQFCACQSLDVRHFDIEDRGSPLWKNHAHVALAETYDQFLATLGSTTRHNFRYYRRRFEASGHRFVEHLSLAELRGATLGLFPKSELTAGSQRSLDRQLESVAAAGRPLTAGLRHNNGDWLSVLGGWYMPDGAAVLCFQCNDEKDFARDSLSVVLRAYLIELLIQRGLKELVIWGDTGPPLSRYASYASTIEIRLDTTARSWRAVRSILTTVGPHLPKRLAEVVQWVV